MKILVIAEYEGETVRPATLSAIAFARAATETAGGEVSVLVMGCDVGPVLSQVAQYGNVVGVDSADLATPLAGTYAPVIASVVEKKQIDMVVAASTSQAKDIVGRAAGLLGGCMASDVVAHRWSDGQLELDRPLFAGAAIATVVLIGHPQIVTVRASSYPPSPEQPTPGSVEMATIDDVELPKNVLFERVESRTSKRPDVTEAQVVVSGGRAFKNSDDFERLVGGLADALHGAAGSSRALVDAGVTPNELQVGQTGKIVAPELYIALGISGAVQHLAGMKNSQTIVAINNDPEAPIFSVADIGLVADVYEATPQLIDKLKDARQP